MVSGRGGSWPARVTGSLVVAGEVVSLDHWRAVACSSG
jgi:hypothetical protein